MDFVQWCKRVDYWRSNIRHMWMERSERERLLRYLETADLDDAEDLKEFLSHNRFTSFPYEWALEVNWPFPDVYWDKEKKMYYVDWNGKRLYWRRGDKKKGVAQCVRTLYREQYEKSPHRYVFPADMKNAVVADIGAAEGCFALDVIDRVQHIYLFECDDVWMDPLAATFAPWKEKVTIVKKYVGTGIDEDCITLDEYFTDKSLDFIKVDIEGAEIDMLSSGRETLARKVRGANVCLYHREKDEADIINLLRELGYTCKVNPGYILYPYSEEPQGCFRRGVVQAKRKLP